MTISKNENTTALITFMRHGEKDNEGNLTQQGFSQARRRGLNLPYINGEIILLHSGVDRVRDTVHTAAAHLHLDASSEDHLELGEHIVSYTSPNLHYLSNTDSKGDYHRVWKNTPNSPEEANSRMRAFISLEDKSPEPGIWLSPKAMAQNIALMIGIEVRFANMISTNATFINGTHEPIIMSFLHYFLHDFKPDEVDTVSELGGSIDYGEGIDIFVTNKCRHNPKVTLRFRNIERSVDLDAVRAFAYQKD